ncbi:MAG TPA: energy transducer TonB [Casimicrobiaceae bacterium]|nr:energy transducer TonB [Casimicrobiaceae bacterium]
MPALLVQAKESVAPARPKRVRKAPVVANDPAMPTSDIDVAVNPPTTRPKRVALLAPAGALPPARIPPEALASPRNDKLLRATFGISIAIHAIVLSIHFAPRVVANLGMSRPLEVALVNAKTKDKPVKADVLAQSNLDGGGNTDKDRRAKSPLPVLPKDSRENEISVATQRLEHLERQTKEVLAAMKATQSVVAGPKAPDAAEQPDLPTANEMMQKTLEAMRLEAQIAKDMDAYQKRPKRKFVGARAEEYRFARYVEDWRLKVERVGNMNYPEAARAKKLYGSLILTVSIRADGSVEHVEVSKSSGQRILDAAAVKIVQMAAPYATFPPDVRRDTDILHITRTWSFTKGSELVSQ